MIAPKDDTRVSMYGSTRLITKYCNDCDMYAFVIDNILQCCNKVLVEVIPTYTKREVTGPYNRTRPNKETRLELLELYDNRCVYCSREFGSFVTVGKREIEVYLNWDHAVPFSYSNDNTSGNFLPACHRCNSWKSNLMFQTIEEAQVYLVGKWADWLGNKQVSPRHFKPQPLRAKRQYRFETTTPEPVSSQPDELAAHFQRLFELELEKINKQLSCIKIDKYLSPTRVAPYKIPKQTKYQREQLRTLSSSVEENIYNWLMKIEE